MKRFFRWPRRDKPQQSIASEVKQRGVKSEQETEDEYSDSSSFDWEETDQHESSGPGGNAPKPDQCDHEDLEDTAPQTILEVEDTAPQTILELEDEPLPEENIGIDPYNKGRFDT